MADPKELKVSPVEGLVTIVQTTDDGQLVQVALKLFREQGSGQIAVNELDLDVKQVERLASFLCALARSANRSRRSQIPGRRYRKFRNPSG